MLEGLEISEVMFQYVKQSSDIFRVDSTFFKREYLKDENLIRKKNNKTLIELQNSILSFGAYSLNNHVNYLDEGIPFIRGINMKNGRIDFSNTIYINKKANELLWKSEVKPSTVLLSMSGTIGDVAIASKNWNYPINSNQDIAKIHPSKNISSYYLYVFLLTKYGQNYLKREARGSVQQHVFLSQIEKFEIPIFNSDFISKIEKLIIEFENSIELSKQTYTQAENLLLEEIGLQNFEPSKEPVNIKSFADSFATSGRLDAEYYQKKYDVIEGLINSYEFGHSTIGESIEYLKTGEYSSFYEQKDKTNSHYLRNTNISNAEIKPDNNYAVKSSKFTTKTYLNEILTSRVGTIGLFGAVNKELVNSVYSDNILCFKLKSSFKALVYSVLFSTKPYQLLLDKLAGGSVQPLITQTSLKLLPLPIIDYKKQQQIANLIEQSFTLKKQSEHLLEVAKQAVEIAIEKNEAIALTFIKKATN